MVPLRAALGRRRLRNDPDQHAGDGPSASGHLGRAGGDGAIPLLPGGGRRGRALPGVGPQATGPGILARRNGRSCGGAGPEAGGTHGARVQPTGWENPAARAVQGGATAGARGTGAVARRGDGRDRGVRRASLRGRPRGAGRAPHESARIRGGAGALSGHERRAGCGGRGRRRGPGRGRATDGGADGEGARPWAISERGASARPGVRGRGAAALRPAGERASLPAPSFGGRPADRDRDSWCGTGRRSHHHPAGWRRGSGVGAGGGRQSIALLHGRDRSAP